jgi:hypothetical protein
MAIRSLKTGLFSRSTQVGNSIILPGDYESIATANGTGSSGTITFSSIPSTFSHLQIRGAVLGTGNADIYVQTVPAGTQTVKSHLLNGNGATTAGDSTTSQIYLNYGITIDSTNPMVFVIDILDYANTNKNKTLRWLSGTDKNGSGYIQAGSALILSTTAMSEVSVKLTANSFSTSSKIALYGIRG